MSYFSQSHSTCEPAYYSGALHDTIKSPKLNESELKDCTRSHFVSASIYCSPLEKVLKGSSTYLNRRVSDFNDSLTW